MTKWMRHTLFWLGIYVLWSYMKSGGTFWHVVLKINVLNVAIYMVAYYFLRYYQLPKLYNQEKYIRFWLSIFLMTVAFYVVWRAAGVLWYDALYEPTSKRPFFYLANYLTQSVQFYSPAIMLLAWEFYHTRQKEKLRIEQLEKEKLANELKFLKAQINPHFLFNALNNLYSFVLNQSPKAPDLIMQLSGMLDYVLYQSQKPTVALQQEVNCIENYIALEKIRYGDRLQVAYEVTGDLSVPIAPLILLSIVENAFKHGASGDIATPRIKIQIGVENRRILCLIWNSKSAFQGEINDAYKEGIGLSNIKRQLKLTYPNQHQLQIDNQPDAFQIKVSIHQSVATNLPRTTLSSMEFSTKTQLS